MENSIDIVITWVDGNDSNWLEERSKYTHGNINKEGIDSARFRDWGTLKYVLRSIEKNAPWVNKIFLITANQVPEWYKENSKLTIISHNEFIPKEYLPTFSSHVIECFLHLVPGLSEKFIYFNDDTLILKPSKPEDFFVNNLPVDYATLHLHAVKKSLMIHQIANNSISIINEYFDFKKVLKDRKYQWINLQYGLKKNLKTLLFSHSPRFSGIEQHHMPQPYLKSTFKEVWLRETDTLMETANHKFRHKNDINQWLFRNWQLASGNFYPISPKYRGLMIDFEKNDEITELNRCLTELQRKRYFMICINDGDDIENLDLITFKVEEGLERAFSEKASWEI